MSALPDRFWAKVRIVPDCCWLWEGALNKRGYGKFWLSKWRLAHKVAYEALVGPVPDGLELDHLCRVHECVNPDHLEPVTHRVNLMRGDGVTARAADATHCLRGHPFDEENTYWYRSAAGGVKRRCRTCKRASDRRAS